MATAFKTYDAVAIREDLSDVIYDISPTDTPFMSSIAGKGSVSNTLFEWQTDALAAAVINNYHVEGADAGTAATTVTARITNQTQISKKVVEVSGSHEAVNNAGKKSELAHQLAKASKELKRDMEGSLLANNAAAAGNASTARETRGAAHFITTNVTDAGSSGSHAAVVEADILAVAESTWTAGGEPSTILLGAVNKKLVTAMSGRADAIRSVSDNNTTIQNAVDVYVSDFGTFNIMLDRFCDQDVVYFLDHDMWSVDYLRDFQTVDIARAGDGEKKMLLVEYGLRCGNEAANGQIRYTTGVT
jgi:hypothetical protein